MPAPMGSEPGHECPRCRSEMKKLLRTPATPDNPPYDIFECKTCGLVDLVAAGHDT